MSKKDTNVAFHLSNLNSNTQRFFFNKGVQIHSSQKYLQKYLCLASVSFYLFY